MLIEVNKNIILSESYIYISLLIFGSLLQMLEKCVYSKPSSAPSVPSRPPPAPLPPNELYYRPKTPSMHKILTQTH